jgi:hypothetical protein
MQLKNLMWKGVDVSEPQSLVRSIVKDPSGYCNCTTYYKASYHKTKVTESVHPEMGKNIHWYYDDGTKGSLTRVRAWVRDNNEQKITLFTPEGRKRLIDKGFPADCFKPVCDLPKPISKARKARVSNGQPVTRVKGEFNIYQIADASNVSWEGSVYDASVHEPKYYIVKNKENWNFSFRIKGLNTLINTKYNLCNLLRFMGLQTDDVVMVSERNVKNLPDSCINFEKVINDLDFTFDKDKVADAFNYSKHHFEELVKGLATLPDNNELKVWAKAVLDNITTHEKFKHMSGMMELGNGKPTKIKTTNPALQLLASNVSKYNWEVKNIVLLANNLK